MTFWIVTFIVLTVVITTDYFKCKGIFDLPSSEKDQILLFYQNDLKAYKIIKELVNIPIWQFIISLGFSYFLWFCIAVSAFYLLFEQNYMVAEEDKNIATFLSLVISYIATHQISKAKDFGKAKEYLKHYFDVKNMQ